MEVMFSIIVPVYNVEKYLRKCIESVLCQKFKNYEIVLINDGGTDNSLIICEEYLEKYPSKIKLLTIKNSGVSEARNIGIKNAIGKYILFLDSDDYWKGDFLESLSRICQENYDIVLSKGFDYVYDTYVEVLEHNYIKEDFYGLNGEESLHQYIKSPTRRWAVWQHIYNRKFLIDHKLFFMKDVLCEDVEWTYKVILETNQITVFNNKFYQYRAERPGSIMNSISFKKWKDITSHCELWLNRLDTISSKILQEELRNIFCHLAYINLYEICFFNHKEIRKAHKIIAASKFLENPITSKDRRLYWAFNKIGFVRTINSIKRYKLFRRKIVLLIRKIVG